MLVLSRAQTEALLDIDALIDALASAMADLSAGRASAPDRIGALVPEHEGLLAAMPGYVPSAGMLMSKLVSLYPHNAGGALPTHQAVIVAFDPGTGQFTEFKSITYKTPNGTGVTYGTAADRDGNGWWAEMVLDIIGKGNVATGKAEEVRLAPVVGTRAHDRPRRGSGDRRGRWSAADPHGL